MKIIGKPYSGKPNVRFDEGELEIELSATTPALYSTASDKMALRLFAIIVVSSEVSFLAAFGRIAFQFG